MSYLAKEAQAGAIVVSDTIGRYLTVPPSRGTAGPRAVLKPNGLTETLTVRQRAQRRDSQQPSRSASTERTKSIDKTRTLDMSASEGGPADRERAFRRAGQSLAVTLSE